MKRIVLFYWWMSCTLVTWAQQTYFNSENFGKEMPGLILTQNGELKRMVVTYDHPDFLKSPSLPLKTSEGSVDKSTITAFQVDGRSWVFRQTAMGPMWVVIERQGAIEVYSTVQSDSKGKNPLVVVGGAVVKGNDRILQSEMLLGYKRKMAPLVADNSELAAKVGEKGYGALQYLNVVDEYNEWYEKNYPGKLPYLTADFGIPIPGKGVAEKSFTGLGDMKAQAQANRVQQGEVNQKKLDDLFANRTSTVSPEMASAHDNIPVKKETFISKLERIRKDGNKVGVYINLLPVRVNPPPTNAAGTGSMLAEGEFRDESLLSAGSELVAELNQALGVTDIDLVDLAKIPYRDIKVMGMTSRIDDWWATRYKVVFAYTLDPRIKSGPEGMGSTMKFGANLNLLASLVVTEYIGDQSSTKQDIITQVLNMGSFTTPIYSQEETITDPKVLYEKVLSKLDQPLLEKIRTERADGVKKLVEKRLSH